MIPIKRAFSVFLRTGISEDANNENVQQVIIINLFSFVGMFITAAMGIIATFNANVVMALVLFCASFVYCLSHYLLARNKDSNLSASIILYSLFILMIYLVHSGGVSNTGPLWIFMVAPVSFFLKGLRNGLISIGVFVSIISLLLFYPDNQLLTTYYPEDFKSRLIYSFLTITFLSAFYEYSRQESYLYVKDLSEKYEKLSKFDPLTGVSNRRDATTKLEYEQVQLERTKQALTIILCDIDHFKKVNDTFGHEVGDEVLIKLANELTRSLRKQDLVSRWGGEEFLLMLPDTDVSGALNLAEKIQSNLAKLKGLKPDDQPVTVSMGIAPLHAHDDITHAISVADKNLYRAKDEGRNRIVY